MTKRAVDRPQKGARPLIVSGATWLYMITKDAQTIVIWDPDGNKHPTSGAEILGTTPDELMRARFKGSSYAIRPHMVVDHIKKRILKTKPLDEPAETEQAPRPEVKMKSLVMYHASCADGFTAAWAAWRAFGDDGADYKAVQYGRGAPELIDPETGDDLAYENIYVLDFSFPARELRQLTHHAHGKVILLDHHKTAKEDLAPLMGAEPNVLDSRDDRIVLVFDMEKSGARLAWEHFHPNTEAPKLVAYVEDRDLWRHALPSTHELRVYAETIPFEFDEWETLAAEVEDDVLRVAERGAQMMKYRDVHVERITKKPGFCRLDGMVVPCLNAPQWQSEIGNKLSLKHPFAVMWFMTKWGKFVYSLRSSEDNPEHIDVGALAKKFGGGGHKHAAGFQSNAAPMMVEAPEEDAS